MIRVNIARYISVTIDDLMMHISLVVKLSRVRLRLTLSPFRFSCHITNLLFSKKQYPDIRGTQHFIIPDCCFIQRFAAYIRLNALVEVPRCVIYFSLLKWIRGSVYPPYLWCMSWWMGFFVVFERCRCRNMQIISVFFWKTCFIKIEAKSIASSL